MQGIMNINALRQLRELHEKKESEKGFIPDIHSLSWEWLIDNTPDAYRNGFNPIPVIISEDLKEWFVSLTDAIYAHDELKEIFKIDWDLKGYVKARISKDLKDIEVDSTYPDKRGHLQNTIVEVYEELIKTKIIPILEKEIKVPHDYIDKCYVVQSYGSACFSEHDHYKYAYTTEGGTFYNQLKRNFKFD